MVKHTRKDIHNCISKGFYQQIITKKTRLCTTGLKGLDRFKAHVMCLAHDSNGDCEAFMYML